MLNSLDPGSDGSKGYARDATGTVERATLAALWRLFVRRAGGKEASTACRGGNYPRRPQRRGTPRAGPGGPGILTASVRPSVKSRGPSMDSPPKSGSHRTPRWRKPDSNQWSPRHQRRSKASTVAPAIRPARDMVRGASRRRGREPASRRIF